jgi:Flp pilus assembly protein TadG
MLSRLSAYLQISGDRRGAIAPLVALTLPVLIGAMGLAVDVGFLYVEHQRLQIAADAAATGAALLLPGTPSTAQLQAAALQAATDASGSAMIGTIETPGLPAIRGDGATRVG